MIAAERAQGDSEVAKPEVIVLGGGMIGVCTALQLRLRGAEVILVDRRAPGLETSYGNAGIIQREAVEPYAFPRNLAAILKVARKGGVDVNYHLTALPRLAPQLARYWWSSAPRRYPRAVEAYARLIAHSVDEHAPLIERSGASALIQQRGWRQAFRNPALLERELEDAQRLERDFGVTHQALDADALASAEPALRERLAGAVHWTQPWTVRDPGALVEHYAELYQHLGGGLVEGDAATLRSENGGWRVDTVDGPIAAAQAVVALGPWSAQLTSQLGYRLPLFVKRGYHRHYSSDGPTLEMPLLDTDNGVMLAPMARGLRLTTGAEFAQLGAPSSPVQLIKAERIARRLLPLTTALEQTPWLGNRPCTPDMLPVIGPAPRHRGLWFHFGHAHQGFTLGPASGRLLAELILGEQPYLDPTPYKVERLL